jgi:hypothetical protein
VFPTHWVIFVGFLLYALSGPSMAIWRRLQQRGPAVPPSEGREPPAL